MENASRESLTDQTIRTKPFATSNTASTNAIQQKPQSTTPWCQSMLHILLKMKLRSSSTSRHKALRTSKIMMQTLLFVSALHTNAFSHVYTSTAQ
jgi:hypothetical protein